MKNTIPPKPEQRLALVCGGGLAVGKAGREREDREREGEGRGGGRWLTCVGRGVMGVVDVDVIEARETKKTRSSTHTE